MQVFVPYREPIKVAECLSGDKRLRKQIIECQQILDAINGVGKGWQEPYMRRYYSSYSLIVGDYETYNVSRYYILKTEKHLCEQ